MKTLHLKNILIPTDFSKTGLLALDQAAFMARLCKADLYLLHAVDIPEAIYMIYEPAMVMPDFKEVDVVAKKKLNELAASMKKKHGIAMKTICTRGKVAPEVMKAVKENKIDLVLMGTHGASGFNEYFIGSNADRVVKVCPCPVITIQTQSKKLGFTNIVLPIDDDFNSRQKVASTVSLAKKFAAKIHLLGLPEKNGNVNLKAFQIKIASVEKVIKKSGLAYDCKIIKTDSMAKTALNYAKKVKADLIVVLNEHESRLTDAFPGIFAKQIVNHSRISVMSIKPENLGIYDSVSLAGSNSY